MDDLVQFLRARLDDDKQAARACASAPWEIEIPPMVHVSVQARRDNKWKWGRLGYVATVERDEDRAHIARHDPARVLADVEAKRRLLELHGIMHREIGWLENGAEEGSEIPVCGICVPKHSHYQRREDVPEGPCLTVRLLALPYADHPDYRDEWRP
jgi:hypothetical protein